MKRVWIIIITLLLAIWMPACRSDSLGDYRKASEKTENIKKGKTSGEFLVVVDFDKEGMTSEQIKELNYYKDMRGNFDVVYDDDEGKAIFRNYLNFGGLGFDFDLFVDGDEVFMKLPVIGKYMSINEMQDSLNISGNVQESPELISKEAWDKINDLWLGLMNKEDVFKGKNIVLTTPDGEVKTREYTIKLKYMQIKSLVNDSIDILLGDEKLKESYEKYFNKDAEHKEYESPEKILNNIKEGIKYYNVENFRYTAYVDIDGYIVNEIIEISIKAENSKKGTPSGISYKLDIKNWDINKEQEFDFPELTEENTIEMDDMENNMPDVIEDLFKKKD